MKMRRVLALVMAVLMVIGLMPAISAVQNQEPAVDDYFTVTKTAEATDVPGIYDIKVTVAPKGKVDVVSGDVEVVFLLDTSSSMAWCTETNPNHAHTGTNGSDTEGRRCEVSARDITKERLHIAKTAINKMISSLNTAFQNSGSTLTVSVVTYASESSVKVDKAVVTNETLEQITKKVSDITSLGGTYMESGLKKASLQFSSGDSSKYLIMIGDGDYDDEDYFDGFLFWGKWNYATDRIKDAASAITKKGATLMTVGFTQDIAIFREIASKDSNGQPMYSRADSDVTLNNILEGITEKISADGIVLEDYVGDNNSIVDTPSVDHGVIESSSTNNIKWNIPSDNAGVMTLIYRISVDPSKLNAGLNKNVPLNGTTKLTYKVAEGDPKEITVQPPTDNLTVAKLYVEYYLDGNLNGDMSRYVDSKFRNDDPATFDFGKPEDTLTVGEGDGATTYKFEKAVQLDDNDTEIPLAFTDNGTTTVNVYNYTQVVRVYYVTEKPEMPEPPQWLGMVTVECVNGEAGHEEKTYEINTGDYTVLDGGVTEVNGEYQYRINLINARYLSAYNADTEVEHVLAENKATEVKFVYEKETGKWAADKAVIKVKCETEPKTPAAPEWLGMVTVKCVNGEAGHEEKTYEINTGDYTVLDGGVTEVNGEYQYRINLINARYLSAYNADTGAEHKLKENKATEIKFVYEKENGRWTHENPTIKVICESEPEMPEPPQWLGMVTVKCVNGKSGHEEKAYEVNTGDYTVLNGGVTEVNGEYQYVINLINARYLSAYNADTGAEHKLKENKATEIKFVYEKENGRWIHENPIIEVICEDMPQYYSAKIVSINLLSATAEKPYDGKPLTKDEFESLEIKVKFTNIENSEDTYVRSYFLNDVTITPVAGQDRTYRISLKLDDNRSWQIDVKFTGYQAQVGVSDNTYGIVGFIENDDTNSGAIDYLNRITTFNYGKLTVTSKDDPIDPPFIVLFPTLEISNKVIAPKNFEKTSFEYDIINVKTGDVEKSVTLKADSSVRVMVTGGTEYMVVPKNLEVPGYIVTTTSTPDSATVTSDKIGNVSVDFTHIYVVGLNTEDHYAYIRGYEDGTIRPEGNITRAEVATIFYRLLSSEALEAFKTTENTFTDVDSDAWYNLAVSTLAKAGVISGYPDGSFNPNGKITRAELVSIATRFFTTIEVGDSKFSDIAGHWAAKAIDEAYIKGIIKGYSDGTFRPDQAVTRAEAMKIVNGILGRPIDTCVLIEGIKLWPDVASEAWYYYVVAEATNAHRYELTTPEKWTAIIIDEIEY